jgi:hypothetical protein
MLLTYRHIMDVCKQGQKGECPFLYHPGEDSEEETICARGTVFQEKILAALRLSPKQGNCSGHPLYEITTANQKQGAA